MKGIMSLSLKSLEVSLEFLVMAETLSIELMSKSLRSSPRILTMRALREWSLDFLGQVMRGFARMTPEILRVGLLMRKLIMSMAPMEKPSRNKGLSLLHY